MSLVGHPPLAEFRSGCVYSCLCPLPYWFLTCFPQTRTVQEYSTGLPVRAFLYLFRHSSRGFVSGPEAKVARHCPAAGYFYGFVRQEKSRFWEEAGLSEIRRPAIGRFGRVWPVGKEFWPSSGRACCHMPRSQMQRLDNLRLLLFISANVKPVHSGLTKDYTRRDIRLFSA